MGKSVVISGATGYVGAHLCRRFVESGWRVLGLVRREPEPNERVEGVEYSQDFTVIPEWQNEGQLRWVNLVGRTNGGVDELNGVNRDAQEPLAELAKKCGAHVIHFSTINVFLGESDRYGMSKLEGEQIWEKCMDSRNLCILRPGLIYGGATDSRLFGLYAKMRKWKAFPRIVHGKMAPLYLHDLGVEVLDLAEVKRSGRIVLTGSEQVSYSEFVSLWNRRTEAGAVEISIPKGLVKLGASIAGALPVLSRIGKKLGNLQRDREVKEWGDTILGVTRLDQGLEQTWSAMEVNENAHA